MDFFENKYLKNFLNTKNKIKIIQNSSWLILDHVIKIFLGLFVGIWVAKYLGPENFGKLSYVMAFVGLLAPLYKLGLDFSGPKEFINKEENKEEILSTIFYLKLIGGLVIFVSAVSFSFLIHSDDKTILILTFFIGFSYIFKSFEVFNIWFLNQLKSKFIFIAKNIGRLLTSILKITFILAGFSILYFGFAITIEAVLIAAALVLLYVKTEKKINFKKIEFNWNYSVELFKKSWLFVILGLTYTAMSNIDKVMIKNMIGSYEIGIYSVASVIPLYVITFGAFIMNATYPVLLKLNKEKPFEFFSDDFQKILNYMVIFTLFVAFVIVPNADFLVGILWGSDYQASGQILSVLIIYPIFLLLGSCGAYWTMFIKNHIYFHLISFFICIILNIILNYFLLKKMGTIGAAYATVISYFILYVLADLFYNKTRNIFIMKLKALFLVDFSNGILKKIKKAKI